MGRLLKIPRFHIPEPNHPLVIPLETDVPRFKHFTEGTLELVGCTIRIRPRLRPLAQICFDCQLVVHHDRDSRSVGREHECVPLPGGFTGVSDRRLTVVHRATTLHRRGITPVGIHDLNLDTRLYRVVQIRPAKEDAAVRSLVVLESQTQFEIRGLLSPF